MRRVMMHGRRTSKRAKTHTQPLPVYAQVTFSPNWHTLKSNLAAACFLDNLKKLSV